MSALTTFSPTRLRPVESRLVREGLGLLGINPEVYTGPCPDHATRVRDPRQEFIVEVTYPAQSNEASTRVQDLSFNSKLMPVGVRNELLRLYDSFQNPIVETEGFIYKLRETQANDYRIYAKIGDNTQAIQHDSSLLNGIDFNDLPTKLNPNLHIMPDSAMLEVSFESQINPGTNYSIKYYKALYPSFYPETGLKDLQFTKRINEIYLKVVNEIERQKLQQVLVDIPELDLSIQLLNNGEQINVRAETLSSRKLIHSQAVSYNSLQISGEDNLVVAFIYQVIEDKVRGSSPSHLTSLPEFLQTIQARIPRPEFQRQAHAA